MKFTTRIIDSSDEFARMADIWREVLPMAIDANTFLSHEWLSIWWQAYQPAAALRIVVAESEGRPVGIAPLMLQHERRLGLRVRVLRFVGDGTSETDHMNFVIHRDAYPAAADALFQTVGTLDWDVAQFNQMPAASALTHHAIATAGSNGWRTRIRSVPCPRRRLPSSFEELLSTMPSRLRTTLRSSRKRLEKDHVVEFGLHQSPAEMPLALQALFENHASRWRAKSQQGVFVDPKKRRFYELLSEALLRNGSLRFFYLKLDGRIVAQEYCFEHDGVVMLLQEGFDVAHAASNVGNVLRSHVFEHLIRSGTRVYDFLAGESRHKRSWSDSSEDDLLIEISRGLRGSAYALPPLLTAAVKARLRPLIRRTTPARGTAGGHH